MCRSSDVPTRKRYVSLVESVKDNNGTVRVFSSLHVSGEREQLAHGTLKLSLFVCLYKAGQLCSLSAKKKSVTSVLFWLIIMVSRFKKSLAVNTAQLRPMLTYLNLSMGGVAQL